MSSADDMASEESTDQSLEGRTAALPDEPSPSGSLLGQRIADRYEIEALIGTGVLGRAFRARRLEDQHPVTLKLLHRPVGERDSVRRRIARDVDAGTKLEHLHIAQVFEHGIDEQEGPFVCRELLEGEDLVTAARRGALTPRRACELIMQVLSALSEAQRHGVLHLNLKPQNVLVHKDESGRECVKVCDFGDPLRASTVAEYMAPEQASGNADGQADVYAVGIMLYELLTDDVPFRGATPEETLALHRDEPIVPPREKRPDRPLPRELEAVCLKALAKKPNERHRSPREMSQALRAVISLLGPRADEPLGSSAFAEGMPLPVTASTERMTMPGEQLRSHTKIVLGAALLAGVCIAVWMSPDVEDRSELPGRSTAAYPNQAARMRSSGPLESGMQRLRSGDAEGAVVELRTARRVIGDTPELLRALGEALVLQGNRSEGKALLSRYLELEPNARDREFVESLVRR